jgi:hypothetical protein
MVKLQLRNILIALVLCTTVINQFVSSEKVSRIFESSMTNDFHKTKKEYENKFIPNFGKRDKDTSKSRFHPHIRLGRNMKEKTFS